MTYNTPLVRRWCGIGILLVGASCLLAAQGFPGFPPEGFGGPRGMGGPGGDLQLVKDFDKDGDGRLNAEERTAARASLQGRRSGGPGGFGRSRRAPSAASQPATPGRKLSPSDVKTYQDEPLYDMATLRTLFLRFENADWESELEDFYGTDVEVPATLIVDGRTYREVGVHFRGNTSYQMVGTGQKRSLNLSLDFAHRDQRLGGYRTLNLLNSINDPTFVRTVLYLQIARDYIPAPKANFVRVVINGESWGVYISMEQFNSDFTRDWFNTTGGARWKVPMNPGGGGLTYLGDSAAPYQRAYEIKTKDNPKSWAALINLCKVLNQTPVEKLEAALAPLLDIDGALKFLAVEKALINSDGYWARASDYSLYLDPKGRFHIFPYDVNESMGPGGGPGGRGGGGRGGFGGGGGGGGIELDPFAGAYDSSKPLLSRLLAVPSLRARYLGYVRDIAERWLDWEKIGPLARQYQALIAADVEADARKLASTDAFHKGLTDDAAAGQEPLSPFGGRGAFRGPGGTGGMSLKTFADRRRAYLLNYREAAETGGRVSL